MAPFSWLSVVPDCSVQTPDDKRLHPPLNSLLSRKLFIIDEDRCEGLTVTGGTAETLQVNNHAIRSQQTTTWHFAERKATVNVRYSELGVVVESLPTWTIVTWLPNFTAVSSYLFLDDGFQHRLHGRN